MEEPLQRGSPFGEGARGRLEPAVGVYGVLLRQRQAELIAEPGELLIEPWVHADGSRQIPGVDNAAGHQLDQQLPAGMSPMVWCTVRSSAPGCANAARIERTALSHAATGSSPAAPPCCSISLSSATGTPSRKPRYTCLPMIR